MDLERKRTGVELKFYELTKLIVAENGYELYDVDYISGSSTLRVFIMDPKTNSALIEDCVKVDRAYNPYCETEEWIPDDFILEVSSPGVYRVLKTREHFEMALNESIEVAISGKLTSEQAAGLSKQDASKTKLRGKLLAVNEENISIEYAGKELSIGFKQMKKANLDPDING